MCKEKNNTTYSPPPVAQEDLPIREPVVLPFDPDTPREIINSAVKNAIDEYFKEKNPINYQYVNQLFYHLLQIPP